MAATAALDRPARSAHRPAAVSRRSSAVPLLPAFAVTVMVIPSDTVIRAIGAGGYAAALIGMLIGAAWAAASLLGLHDPRRFRHPLRGSVMLLWVASLASYVLMHRGLLTVTQIAGADRYMLQLVVITGVVFVAAECLDTVRDVRRVLRAMVWGGAFAGVVAALQYWMTLDVTPYLRLLPGFTLNADNSGILARAALHRVAGTAIHPIELGVVSGMLLPLAVVLAIYDTGRSARRRWTPVALIGVAIATSVSRSAILAVSLAMIVLIVLMPLRQRLVALMALPFAVVAMFMSAPGLISTLVAFFGAGTRDASIASRVDDYPLVERYVHQAPWFGRGGGTYIADNAIDILDNQFLKSAIEIGLVGAAGVAVFFLVPVAAAFIARSHARDPELRLLCAALGGAAISATACAFTFDAFSFPMFSNVHALVLGLIGAVWRLCAREASSMSTAGG